jgi:hypothetical protein
VQKLTIDADLLPSRIDAGAELGDDCVVDFDAAVENELFAIAATGNAGGSEDFLEAVSAVRFMGSTIGCRWSWTRCAGGSSFTSPRRTVLSVLAGMSVAGGHGVARK